MKTLADVLDEARRSWPGDVGEERATTVKELINRVTKEYSITFEMSEDEVFNAIEANRTYSAVNYYQDCNFPSLGNVRVFRTKAEVREFLSLKKFRCPRCRGVSSDPMTCDSQLSVPGLSVCDWKAYGLFGTLGDGFRFVCIESFKLGDGVVHEIFMPLCFEKPTEKHEAPL